MSIKVSLTVEVDEAQNKTLAQLLSTAGAFLQYCRPEEDRELTEAKLNVQITPTEKGKKPLEEFQAATERVKSKRKAQKAATSEEPEAPEAAQPEPQAAEEPKPEEAQPYTLEDVRKYFTNVARSYEGGRAAINKILAEFNVPRLPDLPPERYGDAMERVKAWEASLV